MAAEKAGPNLFKACLQCSCKLALVCGQLKPALHLMQLHSLFPAVCCLSSRCQEREGILNNGCCRTWCLPQADRKCRMSWSELAVLLQNQVDLCKALLQEASTQSERGQARPRILERRLRAECDQQSHQASHTTHSEMCFQQVHQQVQSLAKDLCRWSRKPEQSELDSSRRART
jgi:hypothetical protein